ncbi:hypothetical protein BJX68DRAFT_242851 [Aspergillus pseudodeflectus]|uniref:GAR domain-containing protein n=1 Tax=Aspergillus pseudodeflectus TaxID=176178 RepID=A0ABR4JYQ3_9EURO
MASSRLSPPRRPFQLPPTLPQKASDRLAVPKYDVSDPLLGNLSPESTLQALSNTDAVPKNEKVAHDILSKSISQASPTERALGIRAAVAAQKLGQWYREVQKWEWPKRADAHLGKGFVPPTDAERSGYYGSLPASVVEEHEKRIEEIRDGMESLDVEELKEHVLNAHIPGRSRPSSANSTISVPPPLSYVQLSDFTAVITATILRALPLLSRLNNLLSTWDVRLLVLRQIPGLLQSLQFARSELNSALDLLTSPQPPTEQDVLYSITNYHAKRVTLESNVLSAGRRMDRILDSLDGREDSLPEHWIDDLESTEADFAAWVMQAEKRTVENEWRRLSARSRENDEPQVEAAKSELDKEEDVKDISSETVIPLPAETPFAQPEERDTSPEPVSQTRPVPIQIGRSHPMETIVEEIGSPLEPAAQPAAEIDEFCTVAAETEQPKSPSPLPVDTVETHEAPTPVPAMQLDAATDADLRINAQDVPVSAAKHVISALKPVTTSSVENVHAKISEDLPRDIATVAAVENESSTPHSHVSSPIVESGHPEPSGDSPRGIIQKVAENHQISVPQSHIAPPAQEATVLPHLPKEVTSVTAQPNTPFSTDPVQPESSANTPSGPFDVATENEEVSLPQPRVDSLSEELVTHPEFPDEETSSELTRTPVSPANKNTPQLPNSINSENHVEQSVSAKEPVQIEKINTSVESMPIDELEQTQRQSDIDSVRVVPTQQAEDSNDPASIQPSLSQKSSLHEQEESKSLSAEPSLEPAVTKDNTSSSANIGPSEASQAPEKVAVIEAGPQSLTTEDRIPRAALATASTKRASTPERSSIPERCVTPPSNAVASLPNLFKPIDNGKPPAEQPQPEEPEQEDRNTPKKPLDSPIKLSKMRPGRLDLDKHNSKPRRRTSNGSDGSLSDFPSLVSSPGIPEPRTSSSNGTPLLLETPPNFPTDYRPTPVRRNDHTLREDRLVHLDAQKPSPRDVFTHNRALSLPLQRFINERIEMNYESGSSEDPVENSDYTKQPPLTRRQKSKSATTPADIRRLDHPHLATTREESSGPDSDASSESKKAHHHKSTHASRQQPPNDLTTGRLKKRLTAHPSLESIGPYKSNGVAERSSTNVLPSGTQSRPSSPTKRFLRPKDQMDEKINSILTTLPGRIHLVQADQDDDAVSVASSLPFRRERFRSHSPQGTPTRSFTPTPSLTMRPTISRRRHSHAPEESSVKLYHLHRGGKSAPTKLFVRTVGENGERVMVRVGGGWADLAEYLREYAIHHGRRHVSETPRVEVEGLSSRESPSYSPPGSRVPSGSGRHVPARPRSVLSNRPASSLAVRKTRRSSNVSDFADFRTSSAGDALNVSFSPMSSAFPNRRLSVSSNISAGAMSSVSEMRHGSPSTVGASPAIPLGLAGPKPRAKHATISPESEAWVEDVLGQARRSSSLRPFKLGIPPPEAESEGNTPTLPKSRSISDIGKAGSSKRVALRGLR